MFDEIGSEYWKADRKSGVNKPIEGALYMASGRSAQSLIVEAIQGNCKKTVLLPAYTCQHIVEPFDWKGWDVLFYDINKDLTPNIENFAKQIKKKPGCIVIEGYYGFKTALGIVDLVHKAQAGGSIVIEDITHSFLNDEQLIYDKADYLFCSLRKWSGLSDGGYAISLCGNKLHIPTSTMSSFVTERHMAREIKARYVKNLDPNEKKQFLHHYEHSEEILDRDIGLYCMSNQAYDDYIHLDFDYIKSKRVNNYLYMLEHLKSEYVTPIFTCLPSGITPIMFPVYVDNVRDELRGMLIRNRIYCPVHWPAPIQLDTSSREKSKIIYNNIMSIPCDQRYSEIDMKRMVELINDFHIREV